MQMKFQSIRTHSLRNFLFVFQEKVLVKKVNFESKLSIHFKVKLFEKILLYFLLTVFDAYVSVCV